MKKSFISTALIIGFSSGAAFADGPAIFASGNGAASNQNWAGPYAGLFGAFETGTVDVVDVDNAGNGNFQFVDINVDEFSGGLFGGYNFQRGNFVFGLEVDFTNSGASGSSIVDTANLDETLQWDANWSASLRGRAGITNNNWLFYGTAGFNMLNATAGYLNLNDAGTIIEDDNRSKQTLNGWSAGVGAEKKFSKMLTGRVEYMYSEYETVNIEAVPAIPSTIRYTPSINIFRAGLAWQF